MNNPIFHRMIDSSAERVRKLEARVGILEGFVSIVRANIGKPVKRGRYPTADTLRKDRIRNFLFLVDRHYQEQQKDTP